MRSSRLRSTWAIVVAGVVACAPLAAQSMDGTGSVAAGLLLRQMDGVKRVLVIGAHPDDESTTLLTTLARGLGVETAYLSLTRGDGGQNLIGPELFEGLGVIRTGELVAARRLDGGRQFFTRAFDYGYSKTADEALSLWPRDELLGDVVWIIRRFRPQVIVAEFSGTPRDGHGQHQAAGLVARQAFEAAGDPGRFPEQLTLGVVEPWEPLKLYQSSRAFFGRGGGGPGRPSVTGAGDGAVSLETGAIDPLVGRSLFQLSMESRSQHRSQEMGAPQPPGPFTTGLRLIQSRVGDAAGIFAGIDTTLVGLAASLPPAVAQSTRSHLQAYRVAVGRARDAFGIEPWVIVDELGEAHRHLQQARDAAGAEASVELMAALDRKSDVVSRAVMAAGGVLFDVRSEADLLVPGQAVRVTAQLWSGGPLGLDQPEVVLEAPPGWTVTTLSVEGLAADGAIAPGSMATWTYEVELPSDAELSRLYYLRESREGAWYTWPDEPMLWGLPRDPARIAAGASFAVRSNGQRVGGRMSASRHWRYVGVDPATGEFEKPVLVVPAVSVRVSPDGLVWPAASADGRTVSVVLRSEAEGGSRGTVAMRAPSGWTVTPARQPFDLAAAGTERTVSFEIEPSGTVTPGEHVFEVVARSDEGAEYAEGYALIDYEHIERAALYEPAEARVTVVPVSVAEGLRVGYVMGSGDEGPEAIRQLGVQVELLDEGQVRDGDFEAFDVVVLGVRAYETRADLRAASESLLDWARSGGTVVAQYNRGPFGSLAPLPLETGRGSPRVADETAPVRILEPEAPIFTAPNSIGPFDFQDWVQERGLYFASEWDDGWVPLLELNDPGEPPRHGALLVTSVGDGVFVFTALSFFRQWSARVPGAYRLFANLISLDPREWSAYAASR